MAKMAKRPYSKAHTAKGNPRRYLLSGIPPTLWARARAKAAKEGVSMRSLILTLLVQWLEPVVRHDMPALAQQQRLGEPIGTIGDAVLRTLQQLKGEGDNPNPDHCELIAKEADAMPHTRTLYFFDELSRKAQERARDWYRSLGVLEDIEANLAEKHDYQLSNAYVDEKITKHEYEFTVDGEKA